MRAVAISDAPGGQDAGKARELFVMKAVATGFLLAATAVYLGCLWWEGRNAPGWVGYVRAASEAGMVGALADWFAVTALFRHPLGLPIPHTAIIKRKKDQLGESLSDFVGQHFLAPDVVVAKLAAAQIPYRIGRWLGEPDNAQRVAAESTVILRALIGVIRDEDVEQIIDNTIVVRLAEPKWGPPIGRVLEELIVENRQVPLIDMLAERAHEWAMASQETIDRIVDRDSPGWSPKFVDTLLSEKIYRELVEFTWKIRVTPDHEVRRAATDFLAKFAADLQSDPATIEKAEAIKAEVMGRAEITRMAQTTWRVAKRLIEESVDDPHSTLHRKIAENVQQLGVRLRDDAETQERVDYWMQRGARFVMANYSGEFTSIIADTVKRWDAADASRKIELAVGRDLQFIRINGTVVGALAGLVIYSIGQLLFGS